MKKIFITLHVLCAAFLLQIAFTTTASAETLEDLGFETISTNGDTWAEDTYWGWIAPLEDGWFFHDWTWTYYWSNGSGKIDSAEGIYLYNNSSQSWIWTSRDVFPQYFDFGVNDWVWLP